MRHPADHFLDQDGTEQADDDNPLPDMDMGDLPIFVVVVGQPEAILGFSYLDTFAVLAFNRLQTATTLAQALDGQARGMRLAKALANAIAQGAVLCVVDEVNGMLLQFLHGEPMATTMQARPLTAHQRLNLQIAAKPWGRG